MTQEDKAKRYDEAIERAKEINNEQKAQPFDVMLKVFPELKESEDERIRKDVYNYLYNERHNIRQLTPYTDELDRWLAWLEKQKPINISIEDKRIRKSLINYVKAHGNGGDFTKEKYIDWLEKQGEEKEYTFKSIPRLLDMIEPTDRAKAYCQKLIDTLAKEGYNIDAKIVGECLKTMNGEDVPMAIMDEKQGKQKPDMVEPKFKVGDWIVNNQTSTINLVKSVRDNEYCLWPLDAKIEGFLRIVDVDSEYHLWTIQDAKDGDVVVDKSTGNIGIFESIGNHPDGGSCNDPSYCFLHCRYDDGFFYADFENGNTIDSDDLIPATKAQRALLFKKMHGAGYEWDADKLELYKKPKFKVGDTIIKKHNSDINKFGQFTITDITGGKYWYNDRIICDISDQYEWELVEQKPTDKVEPKFKVGDWVVYIRNDSSREVLQIYDIRDGRYYFNDNIHFSWSVKECDEKCHLWTIKDAKDGDVLVSELCGTIMLYKGIEDNNIQFYCDYDFSDIDVPGDRVAITNGQNYGSVDDSDDWHPATKEQRDLLFSKMNEAGYEWDADKKEVKLLITNGGDFETENCEQNTDWSEVDEYTLDETIQHLEELIRIDKAKHCSVDVQYYQRDIDWLKSFKERIKHK